MKLNMEIDFIGVYPVFLIHSFCSSVAGYLTMLSVSTLYIADS
jgi:hypothetical protein